MTDEAHVLTTPEEIIGPTQIKALSLAGYDIVKRDLAPKRWQWTCPHCDHVYRPGRKVEVTIFLAWGEARHRRCVNEYQVVPSKRGDRRPIIMSPCEAL